MPGKKPVMELLNHNPRRIEKVFLKKKLADDDSRAILELCRKNGVETELADVEALDALCSSEGRKTNHVGHQGIVAILSQGTPYTLNEVLNLVVSSPLPLLLALDQIQDPGNLGAIARTAYALGCAGLILPQHNSAACSPGAMRSSAGALERLPVAIVPNLARALDAAEVRDMHIYGTICQTSRGELAAKTHADAYTHRWNLPAVLVLGNEKKGIRPGVARRCEAFLTIPLARQFDSLNIAQAGAILIGLCAAQQCH